MAKLIVVWMTVLLVAGAAWGQMCSYTLDSHNHTDGKCDGGPSTTGTHVPGFSDGMRPPDQVFEGSWCQIVGITDHLDGIIGKCKALGKPIGYYIEVIRSLTKPSRMALPGVEITAGKGYGAYDVLVYGIDPASLAELADLYKKGAFIDPENGLPALQVLAKKYCLVLWACHPENSSIPFDLKSCWRFVHGYEKFDSQHVGFSEGPLAEELSYFYNNGVTQVALPAASDYHFGFAGALSLNPKERPFTQVFLPAGTPVKEANVVEAMRQCRVAACCWLGAKIVVATSVESWDPLVDERFQFAVSGLNPDKLLVDYFRVICSDGYSTKVVNFQPRFDKKGLAVLIFDFASLGMPGAKVMNLDIGGRLITSSIPIKTPPAKPTNQVASQPSQPQPQPQPTVRQAKLEDYQYRYSSWQRLYGQVSEDPNRGFQLWVGMNADGAAHVCMLRDGVRLWDCDLHLAKDPPGGYYTGTYTAVARMPKVPGFTAEEQQIRVCVPERPWVTAWVDMNRSRLGMSIMSQEGPP